MTTIITSKLKIKVLPSSSKDCCSGWLGDAIKIKLKAPPENGKANKALIKFLSGSLGIPLKNIEIKSGLTLSNKVVVIHELDHRSIYNKLNISLLKH